MKLDKEIVDVAMKAFRGMEVVSGYLAERLIVVPDREADGASLVMPPWQLRPDDVRDATHAVYPDGSSAPLACKDKLDLMESACRREWEGAKR